MPDALSDAKAALAKASTAFPSPKAHPAATPAKAATAHVKSTPTLSDELAAKKTMMDKARSALPRMHNGGPVLADGGYQLKGGELVLAGSEAKRARNNTFV